MIVRPKGTIDWVLEKAKLFKLVQTKLDNISKLFNFEYIETPVFEYYELFHRENEHSDMVKKETYNFTDKSDRIFTLKPEQTASICRAFIENKLYANNEVNKLYYLAKNYRYERPQKGRYREFYQYGVEVFSNKNPLLDAQVILLLDTIIKEFKLSNTKIHINSLGNNIDRKNYNEKVYNYFLNYKDDLCFDCLTRLNQNPLRILDCKLDNEKEFFKKAPTSISLLSDESKEYFDQVISILTKLNIDFIIDHNLVRGIDYYTDIVFEARSNIEGFNNANTIGGGGRYNNLVKELNGPDIGGIGFAIGIERLIDILLYNNTFELNKDLDVYIIDTTNTYKNIEIANLLVKNGFLVDYNLENKKFQTLLKNSFKQNPKYIIIIGEEELNNNYISIKNTVLKTQEKINENDLIKYLKGENIC